jgi:hypothetical protein
MRCLSIEIGLAFNRVTGVHDEDAAKRFVARV